MDWIRRRATGAAAVVLAVVLAGCANTATTAGPPAPGPNTNGDMVIEVSVGGGLVRPAVRVADSLPRIWISGDGRYLRKNAGASGNPALPALEQRRITDTALAGLVDKARAAGLLDENPNYGDPRFADAMVTRVVIVSGGQRHSVLISALGYPNLGLADPETAARARLSEFLDLLNHPERIPGVGGPSTYTPTGIAVFVLGAADPSAPTPPATWPLGDLASAGETTDWPDRSARCEVVTGADAAAVAAAAEGRDQSTPWRSGDGQWDVALRPLLPNERSCADVLG